MNNNRIVIVDDNRGFGETIEEFLTLRGYNTRLVTDISVAREVITQVSPSLVIIDVRLINPEDQCDQSGLTLARQLDERLPKIILSDFPSYQIARETLTTLSGKAIAVDVVNKKDGLETLLTSVRLALAPRPSTFNENVLTTSQVPGSQVPGWGELWQRYSDLRITKKIIIVLPFFLALLTFVFDLINVKTIPSLLGLVTEVFNLISRILRSGKHWF